LALDNDGTARVFEKQALNFGNSVDDMELLKAVASARSKTETCSIPNGVDPILLSKVSKKNMMKGSKRLLNYYHLKISPPADISFVRVSLRQKNVKLNLASLCFDASEAQLIAFELSRLSCLGMKRTLEKA